MANFIEELFYNNSIRRLEWLEMADNQPDRRNA